MADPRGRYLTGYYESWSENAFSASGLTDNQVYQASNFAQAPGPVIHVLGANSWDGTGLNFSSSSQGIVQAVGVLLELGRKALLSVGGATYVKWGPLVVEAGKAGAPTKRALTRIVKDFGFDGLDVDLELSDNSDTDWATMTEYAQAIQALREASDDAGQGKLLTVAVWSTGADYTASTVHQPGSPGTVTFGGGNAGRERHVFPLRVPSGPHEGQTVADLIDVCNVMSYDATTENFDPVVAWTGYRDLLPSAVPVGTFVAMDQYNVTDKGPYSVQRFVGSVVANRFHANPHDGAMLWDLCITTSLTDADANSVAACVGTLYGWQPLAP